MHWFSRIKSNLGKIFIGELNGLPHFFNKGHLLRTKKNGYQKGSLSIGSYTFIGPYVSIGPNSRCIGNFCSIAQGAVIGGNIHPINELSTSAIFYAERWGQVAFTLDDELNNRPTIIEHDVWIGNNAIIMPGVTLGTGCVVGAGAIVTKDVKPFDIVVGVPAKTLKKRFDNATGEKILESHWWEYEIKEALNYYNQFKTA